MKPNLLGDNPNPQSPGMKLIQEVPDVPPLVRPQGAPHDRPHATRKPQAVDLIRHRGRGPMLHRDHQPIPWRQDRRNLPTEHEAGEQQRFLCSGCGHRRESGSPGGTYFRHAALILLDYFRFLMARWMRVQAWLIIYLFFALLLGILLAVALAPWLYSPI
jgi:hypothetical protein